MIGRRAGVIGPAARGRGPVWGYVMNLHQW